MAISSPERRENHAGGSGRPGTRELATKHTAKIGGTQLERPSVTHLCRECRALLLRTREWRQGAIYVSYEHIYSSYGPQNGRRHDPDPIPLAGYLN
jgi:hypothetical protein